jgi:hypothetical protein
VEVASQHAEAVSEGARDGVEEGLLLDWIALDAAYVPPRDIELAAAVVAYLTDAGLAFRDGAGVSAGVAAQAVAVELLDQLGRGLADVRIEDVFERGHLVGILLL